MEWIKLRKKHTELPRKVYLWGVGVLSLVILVTGWAEKRPGFFSKPLTGIRNCAFIKAIWSFICRDPALIQNIALGVLGSLLCSWLLDWAGGKAKIRKIRAQYNKLLSVMENEKEEISSKIKEYGQLVGASEDESYTALYTFPEYGNGDSNRGGYYRSLVQSRLTAIRDVCLEAEALIDEARYLLFRKEKDEDSEAMVTCEELKQTSCAYKKVKYLRKKISEFEIESSRKDKGLSEEEPQYFVTAITCILDMI